MVNIVQGIGTQLETISKPQHGKVTLRGIEMSAPEASDTQAIMTTLTM